MMGNVQMRQAFQAALDHEPIMIAAHSEGFYRLDPKPDAPGIGLGLRCRR